MPSRSIRALAGLGQGLGIAVSAEGVGDAADGRALLGAGVQEGQGGGAVVTAIEAGRLAVRSTG